MRPAAAELFETALQRGSVWIRREDGSRRPVPVGRWLQPTAADRRTLERAAGPVLDVGCGPGRHVLALARQGVLAVGVDIAPAAVRHARSTGATVMLGSVFDPLPGAGHWRTALLLDGNIGIGGAPATLLTRLRSLLAPDGAALCELRPPGAVTRAELVALEDAGGSRSEWFPWARVSVDGIERVADRAGLGISDCWQDDGRWFTRLCRTATAPPAPARSARPTSAAVLAVASPPPPRRTRAARKEARSAQSRPS